MWFDGGGGRSACNRRRIRRNSEPRRMTNDGQRACDDQDRSGERGAQRREPKRAPQRTRLGRAAFGDDARGNVIEHRNDARRASDHASRIGDLSRALGAVSRMSLDAGGLVGGESAVEPCVDHSFIKMLHVFL
jgi:hypothetical protein